MSMEIPSYNSLLKAPLVNTGDFRTVVAEHVTLVQQLAIRLTESSEKVRRARNMAQWHNALLTSVRSLV